MGETLQPLTTAIYQREHTIYKYFSPTEMVFLHPNITFYIYITLQTRKDLWNIYLFSISLVQDLTSESDKMILYWCTKLNRDQGDVGNTLFYDFIVKNVNFLPLLGGDGDNISWCRHICYISGASQVTCHSDYFRLSPSGQFLFRAALILWGGQFEGKIIYKSFILFLSRTTKYL